MTETPSTTSDQIRRAVRDRYGAIAAQVGKTASTGCCNPSGSTDSAGSDACCSGQTVDPITSDLYAEAQTLGLPADAVEASLGCGNPTALAELLPGETVLDLGSGGGIDVLLSAQRVGPDGFVYGLDMTDEMLALARRNQKEAGATNVEFLKGEIESIPLPDASVDVIISNCVINLSADKDRVLTEAARVLRPGGRLAVSDVARRGERRASSDVDLQSWSACVAGALHEDDYRQKLVRAGFAEVEIEPTRVYGRDGLDDTFMSAFVRATR